MKIEIRKDLQETMNIPFDTVDGTFYLDNEHVKQCQLIEQCDDGWVWARCPDLGVGQFMSVDLDFNEE
jgi:hypothetical protein